MWFSWIKTIDFGYVKSRTHNNKSMLLRFGVENYRSIRDYQELLLTASSLKDASADLLTVNRLKRLKVLPSAGIYGANASGKSNVLSALVFMRSVILNSYTHVLPTGGVSRFPFKLDKHSSRQASRFDCDVMVDGVRYHYGFKCNDEKILEEWLYAYPKGSRQVWFHRGSDEKENYFGKFLKGKNRTIEALTRPNSLFLSAAAQTNHEQLSGLYKYFEENYIPYRNEQSEIDDFLPACLEDETMKPMLIDFLKLADMGIADVTLDEREAENIDAEADGKEIESALNTLAGKYPNKPHVYKSDKMLRLAHQNIEKSACFLDLEEESRGTWRMLALLPSILTALTKGKVVIVDELDSSMHPLLSIQLLKLFGSARSNTGGAQLIFTTHDTNVLCSEVLRRDQIWFTEKDKEGVTCLYPLTDIETRQADDIERGYLQGRFGGVPFLGGLDTLFEEKG